MAIINTIVSGDRLYKVLLTDSATHTPVVGDKYYVKLDSTSTTGFSGVYDETLITSLAEYFTGWIKSTVTEGTNTFGYCKMTPPPRVSVTITVDQDDATITTTTATGS